MPKMQELLIGFGKGKQADIVTANALASIWALKKLNVQIVTPKFVTESDADEMGKGHEFGTAQYKSHMETSGGTLEKYLSSEFAAWLFSFGLGKVTKSGTAAPYTYTCTPLNTTTDGEELPYFSYIEQMRPGGSAVRDVMLAGCAVKSFRIDITKGPGRANAKATVEFVHSGKIIEPSAITLPAGITETLLNAYSLACTINGVDYVTPKNFESLSMGWDNAFLDGFFPGSGQQDGYQIQGRFENGKRVPSFSFVARYANGSTELAKVRDLTTGTAVIGLTADANNSLTVTWQKMGYATAELGESNGKVVVQVTGSPLYDSTNGIVSAVVKCGVDGICQ